MTKDHSNQFCYPKQACACKESRLVYLNFDIFKSNDQKVESRESSADKSVQVESREKKTVVNGVPIDAGIDDVEKNIAHGVKKSPDQQKEMTGEEFMKNLPPYGEAREQAIYEAAIESGNIPEDMKEFKAVEVSTVGPDGRVHKGKIFVAPDYFKIKGVRVPMDPRTAKAIADHYGAVLPTKKMVDEIYVNADTKVDMAVYNSIAKRLGVKEIGGDGTPDGRLMTSKEFYLESNRITDERLQQAGHKLGQLVAGMKKNIVIMKRLQQKKGVAIYGGLQNSTGKSLQSNNPKIIQPLGIPHEDSYADYSHGVRLIKDEMELDGKMVKVADVLKDPVLSKMISDEGPIDNYLDFYKIEGRFKKYQPQPNFFGIPGRPSQKPAKTVAVDEKGPSDKTFDNDSISAGIIERENPDEIVDADVEGDEFIDFAEEDENALEEDNEIPDNEVDENISPAQRQRALKKSASGQSTIPSSSQAPSSLPTATSTSHQAESAGLQDQIPHNESSKHNTANESHNQSTTQENPIHKPEKPAEEVEASPDGTVRIIGDSLSQGAIGAAGKLGINALPQYLGRKTTLGGQTTIHGERTINQMPDAPQKGALIGVFLGTNDVFSNFSPDAIIATLQRIYVKATEKGYTLIGCTIPPLCESAYTAHYGKYTDDQLEERWKKINNWILAEGPKYGLKKIIPFHTILADPNNPRRLNRSISAKDGLHLNDYTSMAQEIGKAMQELTPAQNMEGRDQNQQAGQEKVGQNTHQPEQDFQESPSDVKKKLIGFEQNEEYSEQTLTYFFPEGDPKPLRVHINAPIHFNPANAIISFYTLPEGNTIEQTIGSNEGHWRNKIQHIGAQMRDLRESTSNKNRAVVYVEGPKLSLIHYLRNERSLKGQRFNELIQDVKAKLGTKSPEIHISGHSGGGSLKFAYLEQMEKIPDEIKRMSFLDSNYGCRKEHIDKLTEWLQRSNDHFLTVSVYDDREVQVKDPHTGEMKALGASSYLRAQEMMEFFTQNGIFLSIVPKKQTPGFTKYTGLNGRINFVILDNPQNKIRHSETVEFGFEYTETAGTPNEKQYNNKSYQNLVA